MCVKMISKLVVLLCVLLANYVVDCIEPIELAISTEREWRISENAQMGQQINKIQVRDASDAHYKFSVTEPNNYGPPSWLRNGTSFFRIDSATGDVYLHQPLTGLAGQQFVIGAAVTNGLFSKKMDFVINVRHDRIGSSIRDGPASSSSSLLPFDFPGSVPSSVADAHRRRPPPIFPASPMPILPPFPVPTSASAIPTRITSMPLNDSDVVPTATVAAVVTSEPVTPAPPLDPATEAATPVTPVTSDGDMDDTTAVVTTIVLVVLVALILAAGILLRKRTVKKRLSISSDAANEKMETFKTLSNSSALAAAAAAATAAAERSAMSQWSVKKAVSNRYESWNIGEIDHEWRNQSRTEDGWEFPRHHLNVINILGEGCFGQVWKCEALNIAGREGSSLVAVKTLKESAGSKERQDLLKELQVMKAVKPHPNIVTLLGCCIDKDPVFVIMEYVNGGKLQSFLRKSRADHYYGNLHGSSGSLSSRDLTSFAYQTAKAMDYLTTIGIIHRDLAARNVLITEDRVCKVADFGFARDVMGNHIYERKSEGRLPIRWMAPESLYDNIFSAKTDVWSFGILLWEIVTLGSTPYPGMAASEVMKKVREGFRLDKPEHCKREVYNVMFYCWEKDPNQRPGFSELVDLLEQLLMSETDYIELERFPDHSYYNMTPPADERVE